jgi:hypothetical protein
MYYYHYAHDPESQYTVFRSHPVYPYLSIFVNKIFFIKSQIVLQKKEQFSEIFDLFEDESLKKFNFISVLLNGNHENNHILSELEMTCGLNSYEYNSIKSALESDRLIRKSYPYESPENEFVKLIKELFGFENIDNGGLLWFEPYLHGFKIKFLNAKEVLKSKHPINIKKTLLLNCDIENVINRFNSELKNEKIDILNDYSAILEKLNEFQNADINGETNIRNINLIFKSIKDRIKNYHINRGGDFRLEIRENDGYFEVHVPTIEEQINLTPVAKSLYFLILIIPDGIKSSNLHLYKDVLNEFYFNLSTAENTINMEQTIDNLCESKKEILTQKSRTKRKFKEGMMSVYDESLCDDMIRELTYMTRTQNLTIPVKRNEVKGLDYLQDLYNGNQNGLLN